MILTYFSGDAPELSPIELSLYGKMDVVRQAVNAGIRRWVDAQRECLGGRVLDYGAGKLGSCRTPQPFRSLLGCCEYVPWEPGDPDPTGKFDGILCTQVVQNFDAPALTFGVLSGYLKPGAYMVMTYPVAWEEIEQERWRFTAKGMWALCHRSGLHICRDEPLASVQLDGSLKLVLVRGMIARKEI
jgi:hypothetical protein